MNARESRFLAEVLGEDGSAALRKAAERCPELGGALVPRAILSWLSIESALHGGGYDGALPGNQDVTAALRKADGGWSGRLSKDGQAYDFKDRSLFHVAGAVAVMIDVDMGRAQGARDVDVERLGRSVDTLAKACRVRREMQKKAKQLISSKEEAKVGKAEGVGRAAAPQAPQAPAASQQQPMKQAAQKIPQKPKKPPALRVMKSESGRACALCGQGQFASGVFIGCRCFRAMAGSVTTKSLGEQYQLDFGPDWSREAVLTLSETWRR